MKISFDRRLSSGFYTNRCRHKKLPDCKTVNVRISISAVNILGGVCWQLFLQRRYCETCKFPTGEIYYKTFSLRAA